jgi:flagellar basal body L-ring protein FlgH
MKDLKQ